MPDGATWFRARWKLSLKTFINGIDVDRQRASETSSNSSLGSVPVVCTQWLGGTQTRTAVSAGSGSFAREFTIHSDYPELQLGSGAAPSPLDLLLAAVGSSFVTSFVLVAAAADVRIESIRVRGAASFDYDALTPPQGPERSVANLLLIVETNAAASLRKLHQLCAIALDRAPVVALSRLNVRLQITPVEGSTP